MKYNIDEFFREGKFIKFTSVEQALDFILDTITYAEELSLNIDMGAFNDFLVAPFMEQCRYITRYVYRARPDKDYGLSDIDIHIVISPNLYDSHHLIMYANELKR